MSSKIAADLRRGAAALAMVCLATVASPARAQQVSRADAAMAQSLFDEGRKLMAAQRYAEACPKLAESQRLDPALGTLLNLAVCHERSGRTATAWSELRDAMSVAKRENRPDREAYAREHLERIEPQLSRITITRARGADDKVEVRLDDEMLGEAALGTAVTIDPGVHRVTARAPGKKEWSAEVTIGANAERRTIEIPLLAIEPSRAAPESDLPAAPPSSSPPMRADVPAEREPGSARKPIGFLVGGIGLAALGVGTVAGVLAISKWSERTDQCPGDRCSPAGLDADKSARRWATVADVGIGAGIVGLGVGAILVLTSRSSASAGAGHVARLRLVPSARGADAGMSAVYRW